MVTENGAEYLYRVGSRPRQLSLNDNFGDTVLACEKGCRFTFQKSQVNLDLFFPFRPFRLSGALAQPVLRSGQRAIGIPTGRCIWRHRQVGHDGAVVLHP